MVSSTLGAALALVVLIGLAALEARAWLQKMPKTSRWQSQVAYLSLGLLFLSVVWQGIERSHVPPIGFDEVLLLVSGVMQVIYLQSKTITRSPNGFAAASLLLTVFIQATALLIALTKTPYVGLEPLWVWALPARWSLLIGIAGLNWLAIIAGLTYCQEMIAAVLWQARLSIGLAEMARFSRKLRPLVIGAILLGSCLAIGRNLWGWGDQRQSNTLLVLLILLLAAGWWLRFTRPHRKLWSLSLMLLAFIAAWPALAAMAG